MLVLIDLCICVSVFYLMRIRQSRMSAWKEILLIMKSKAGFRTPCYQMQREVKSNCKYSNAQNISHPFSYALNARCIDVSMSIKCPLTLSKMKPLLIGAKFFISAIYQAIIFLQLEVFLNAFFCIKCPKFDSVLVFEVSPFYIPESAHVLSH